MWNWIPKWLGGGLARNEGTQSTFTVPLISSATKVTDEAAMKISAVWAAVQLLSKTLASLSLDFYRVSGGTRVRADDYSLAELFRGKVNRYQTRTEFFETVGLNLYLTGNAYCLITRVNGKVVSLLPLMSAQVEVELLRDGSKVYKYTTTSGQYIYGEDAIWHIKLFGDGITGLSPLQYAKGSIGLAIEAEKWASSTVGNAGKRTGVITVDTASLTPDQRTQLRERYKDLSEGGRETIMVLEKAMDFKPLSLSPGDVQLLESRRFQIEDIARFFGVPSVLINDTSGSTVWGSGIEQIIIGWYKLGFRPELERFESSIKAHLIPRTEWDSILVEFDFEELLRTDFKTRVETGSKAVQNGLMTRNEWRGKEWLPSVDGGDELTVQVNLTPLTELPPAVGVTGDEDDEESGTQAPDA